MQPQISRKTCDHLEWHRVLEALAYHCRGPVAEAEALSLDFPADLSTLNTRLDRVTEARVLLDAGRSPPVGHVQDVIPAVTRAARGGVLEAEELVAIGQHLDVAARCRRFFSEVLSGAPNLVEVANDLADRPDLGRTLLDSFDTNGQLVDSASGELGHLRTRVTGLHAQLKESIHTVLGDAEYADLLQDEYYTIREDRYVLPIKSGHKRHVKGIVHGWSASGATVYIEPEAVMQANNRLLMAQAEVDREVRRILVKLSKQVGGELGAIRRSQAAVVALDLACAAAALSKQLDATRPVITEQREVHLKQARHPLLLLQEVEVIPNDLSLGRPQQALVITGPNTGGKTVALKTVGLCTLMGLAGLHIPAQAGSVVPRVPGVYTDIGDEQSLASNKSTFSGHIANLMAIFEALDAGSMVLLDELVVGTDPLQGAALAQAICERFADLGVLLLVTTHYESLKALPFDDERFRNGAMGFDAAHHGPTYALELDVPGASSALSTARRLGLAASIVERAVELTGPEQRRLDAIIRRLEAETAAARKARLDIEQERDELRGQLAEVESARERLRERLRDGIARERNQALRTARGLRDDLERLQRQLKDAQKKKDPEWLAKQQRRVGRMIGEMMEAQRETATAAAGPAVEAAKLRIGQKVWVKSLMNTAELVTLPDDRGRCEVRAGIIKSHVHLSELRLHQDGPDLAPPKAKPKAAPKPKPEVTWETAGPQAPDNTVDVRGMRGEPAIERIEQFLDGLYESDRPIAFIIHGHGTGILKKLVRERIPSNRCVRDWRRGGRHEGGDGVTAVLLK
jgi:DNA mismatch repair protein MutS2